MQYISCLASCLASHLQLGEVELLFVLFTSGLARGFEFSFFFKKTNKQKNSKQLEPDFHLIFRTFAQPLKMERGPALGFHILNS